MNEYELVLVFRDGTTKKVECTALDHAQAIADDVKPAAFFVKGIKRKRKKHLREEKRNV